MHSRQKQIPEKVLSQFTEERNEKNRSHKEFFQVREDLSNQLSDLDKEHFRLDNQKERLSDYLERQINYMWEEYELTASEAEKFRDEELEHSPQLKKMISQLKGEIKALGPVNVNAIEEYKELHERHEFLSAQHADLVKAGEDLKKIITELDEGMRRQFKEKFAIMQQEFEKAFKELFGGGKGSLELVGRRRGYSGSRYQDYRSAAWKEAGQHDADVRWRKGTDSHCTALCHSEYEAVTVLSSG